MNEGAPTLAALGEFGVIDRVLGIIGTRPNDPSTVIGNGDDAAVVRVEGDVVIATDSLVQDRHFRLAWSSGADIGAKAVVRSCADIAAMGGRPTAIVVALCAPNETPVELIEALAEGVRDEAARAGAAVVGGDTTQSDRIFINVTAIGTMAGLSPVTRAGAQVGDVVVVLGLLGHAAAGLARLRTGSTDGELVAAQRRPQPDYSAGPALAAAGAHALIDISDGLVGDLGHIAKASGVLIELDSAAIPLAPGVTLTEALTGGEDHAFAATLPADAVLPDGAIVIGRVSSVLDEPGVLVDGESVAGSWTHFSGGRA